MCRLGIEYFIIIENINVPCIPGQRSIFEGEELIGNFAGRNYLTFICFIVDTDDVACVIKFNFNKTVFQKIICGFQTVVIA
jgi:hypothetical protein